MENIIKRTYSETFEYLLYLMLIILKKLNNINKNYGILINYIPLVRLIVVKNSI